jgi:putative FmdB family regulatory protein
MPTYEYRCPVGHEFERFQKMTDPARAKCPVCGRNAVRQISGGAGLIFKGSGFYITDYGKDGKGPRQDKEAAEAKGEAAAAKPEPAAPKAEPAEPSAKGEQSDQGEKREKSAKAEPAEKVAKKSSRKRASS